MKKILIPIAVALSVGVLPSLFADTGTGSTSGTGTTTETGTTNTGSTSDTGSTNTGSTNTGTTSTGSTSTGSTNTGSTSSTGSTSTGSTNTGTTNTGTTNTGSTNTGTTNTGSTSTGSTNTGSTNTGIINCSSGNIMSNLAAREAYVKELGRLLAEKRTAYEAAMSLSGTAKKDAIKSANEKFRAGQKAALKNLTLARKPILICKKIENKKVEKSHDREDDHDSRDNHNNNKGFSKKVEKALVKFVKKIEKESHRGGKGRH